MYQTYETKKMPKILMCRFLSRFDRKIGTDREVNYVENGRGYVVCLELTPQEVKATRKIENEQ